MIVMALIVYTILLLASSGHGLRTRKFDESSANHLVDIFLGVGESDSTNIKDQSWSFPLSTGSIKLQEGSLIGLSSISRAGDVKVKDAYPPGFTVDIKFDNLKVYFKKYKVYAAMLKVNSGTAQTLSVDVTARIRFQVAGESICDLEVKDAEFVTFGDFDVELHSTCTWCASISDVIFNRVLSVFNSKIKGIVKDKLVNQLKLMLEPYNEECQGFSS